VATTAAAAGMNFLVQPLEAGRAPFVPFFPALILTAFYGGFPAGLAAVALSMLTVDFFWMEPTWQVRYPILGTLLHSLSLLWQAVPLWRSRVDCDSAALKHCKRGLICKPSLTPWHLGLRGTAATCVICGQASTISR